MLINSKSTYKVHVLFIFSCKMCIITRLLIQEVIFKTLDNCDGSFRYNWKKLKRITAICHKDTTTHTFFKSNYCIWCSLHRQFLAILTISSFQRLTNFVWSWMMEFTYARMTIQRCQVNKNECNQFLVGVAKWTSHKNLSELIIEINCPTDYGTALFFNNLSRKLIFNKIQ